MQNNEQDNLRRRRAAFRFSVVGPLLARQFDRGELQQQVAELAKQTWKHPISGEPVMVGSSTIERWYYRARSNDRDPVGALEQTVPASAGRSKLIHSALGSEIRKQHQAHPSWTYLLHYQTLEVLSHQKEELKPLPSYPTVRRYMQASGLQRQKKRRGRVVGRERRSYEVEEVHALWHSDFHLGRRKVVTHDGTLVAPVLLGFMDDHSRIVCHLQWYLKENARTFAHGLMQALMKRGLPRALLTDNGKPMLADEVTQGLQRLGIVHETTLPYTPEANGKQESFWGQVEGRLMAQLEGEKQLTLELLNRATCAWVEQDYNQRVHSELKVSPMTRFLEAPSLGRDCPEFNELRLLFRRQQTRRQRRSDGTITLEGRRFELPSRYRMLRDVHVRYAVWDLSSVSLVDRHSGKHLTELYPQDKARNADGHRRPLAPMGPEPAACEEPQGGISPLLAEQMRRQEQSGLPPAYMPDNDGGHDIDEEEVF